MYKNKNDNRKVVFHADDFGISKKASSNILSCIYEGCITSISMICNTEGYEDGRKRIAKTPDSFSVRLHLNLVEGQPVADKTKLNKLINKKGLFRHSFLSLWLMFLFSSRSTKNQIKQQVIIETIAQIKRFQQINNPEKNLSIDSHTHIHMLPFVINIILSLADQYRIRFIRLPYEPFFIEMKGLKNYFSSNLLKHFILKYLSLKGRKKISAHGISFNQYFIGILFTGNVTIRSVAKALEAIPDRGLSVEVLLHPGGVDWAHEITWTDNKKFINYYLSCNRKKEAFLLKSDSLKKLW